MKKLITCIMIMLIAVGLTFTVFADGDTVGTDEDEDLPVTVVETVAVSETVALPEADEPTNEELDEIVKTTSERIISWVKKNYEEIWVIVWSLCIAIVIAAKNKILDKSVKTLNNNAVSVSENSASAIKESNDQVLIAKAIMEEFKEKMASMLDEVRLSEEEKRVLSEKLSEVTNLIKTAKLANKELADEVAELLVLANIPNAKKDELYARHRAAVAALTTAEQTEVKADETYDGKEA